MPAFIPLVIFAAGERSKHARFETPRGDTRAADQ
jgi:hypothetical protein